MRLQDLSNLILAIAYLVGAITTLFQVIIRAKRSTPKKDESDTDKSIAETKKEIKRLEKKIDKEEDHKK